MTRWTTVLASVDVPEEVVDGWLRSVADGPGSHASRVLGDKAGEGDLVWTRVVAPGGRAEAPAPPPGLRVTEDVPVVPLASRVVPLDGAQDRYLRSLFLRVRAGVDRVRVRLLESSLVAMPTHITTIRSWSLSRLDPAATTAGWTHLWEQELEEARGFRPYMGHPYHWTGVERWFDPEVPGSIVDAEAHYMSPVLGAVITEQEDI